jgi:outer membrane protein TolC
VTLHTGPIGAYTPGTVSPPNFTDTPRLDNLIRAGNLYLSLQDAIALALENNLDIELERYGLEMGKTDTYRAQGGGTLRGVPLAVNEAPTGVGGPGEPLINTAATGVTPQSTVSLVVTDTGLITDANNNLAVTGTFPFASGPAIPLFDPTVTAQTFGQHTTTLETGLNATGSASQNANAFTANAGYLQGFGPGTSIAATFQNQYLSENSRTNLFNPFYASALGVTITQPLLRGFGFELNRRFIRIAQNSEKISGYVFQQQVTSTVSGVMRLYYDLVALNEDLRVKQETLVTAQRLLEDNQNKVDQGTLAPIEATRAQAQVAAAQQDEINSEGFVRQQELIMKNVLARNWSADPAVHDARIVPTDALAIDPLPAESPAELVAGALNSRPEYQSARLQLANTEINLTGTRNQLKPELDLVGSVQNSGLAGGANNGLLPFPVGNYPGLNGNYGSVLEQILARDYPSYSVGLNLTLPVRNRIAQSDVARDEIQLHQTEIRLKQLENQIRVEVEDALIALQRSRASYEAAVQTRQLQEQSLEIEQEKFGVGLSTNFLVIQYQSYAAQARSAEVAALDAYAKARVQFERVTGAILNDHNVSIDEALHGHVARNSVPGTPAAPPPPLQRLGRP